MRVFRYTERENFGDVLNDLIWPRQFPGLVGVDDGVLLMGIGTLVGSKLPGFERLVVFGSGAGIYTKPVAEPGSRVEVRFVRGPLTAHQMGLPPAKAITDPAILIARHAIAAAGHGATLFMPHWETALEPWWAEACALAGLEYLDPLLPVPEILGRIKGARLVVTEAMHGAIVADALRVPWVPVALSPRFNPFKWADWLASMELDGVAIHSIRGFGATSLVRRLLGEGPRSSAFEERVAADPDAPAAVRAALARAPVRAGAVSLLVRRLPPSAWYRADARLVFRTGPHLDALLARRAFRPLARRGVARLAAEIGRAASSEHVLSRNAVFQDRLARVEDQVRRLREELEPALTPSLT